MSKIGQWNLQMEEDASDMSKDEFVKKYGDSNVDVWNKVNSSLEEHIDQLAERNGHED
tara:strand:+ start:1330 stop:1503 length:174 start_codon:yes stop_codon:yes gene_type:complete